MIADSRVEPDALIVPVADAATLWDLPAVAARRAYTALEGDGLPVPVTVLVLAWLGARP